jgi:hypothetical protein
MKLQLPKPEKMWAIMGQYEGKAWFYIGTWLTRHAAITAHLQEKHHNTTWKQAVAAGDRAVKVLVKAI